MTTFAAVLARANITVPDELIADITVPVLTGPQRQGDVGVFPRAAASTLELADFERVPAAGVAVVSGETTGGNTHLLQPDTPDSNIMFRRTAQGGVSLGVLHVPDGAVAWLIHTDEHGANGIGPGCYLLNGKREQADIERRVAD